jgi:5-methylcytosine-specific restriction endonuclease McrA
MASGAPSGAALATVPLEDYNDDPYTGLLHGQLRRVLLLNASWEPLRIVSWQRAILLHFSEKVEVVDHFEAVIRSPSQNFKLPSVVRLKRYIAPKRYAKILRFSRQHVFLRDGFKCVYCRALYSLKELTLDHVIPVVKGGERTWTNVVTCCVACNQKKGARTPQEAGFNDFKLPKEPSNGFLPDLLFFKDLPEAWEPYLKKFLFQSLR